MTKLNLLGTKNGKLTVLEEIGKNKVGYTIWKCQCDCGKFVVRASTRLNPNTKSNSKSCGCSDLEFRRNRAKMKMINRKFGILTVLDLHETTIGRPYNRLCLCECGKTKPIRGDSLISNSTTSCGCIGTSRLSPEQSSFNDLFSQYSRKAHNRKYDFSLTKEQFRKITSSNCYYCGIEPKQIRTSKTKKRRIFI